MGMFKVFMMTEAHKSMDNFLNSYIESALWSSNDDNGVPLDSKYSIDDIEKETIGQMEKDCNKFKKEAGELYKKGGWGDTQAAHDFWLTRNGHGAGFWDRTEKEGYDEEIGKKLTDIAKKFGEYNLYVTDDKKIAGM